MRTSPLTLAACLCLAFVGCAKKDIDIVGKWKLSTPAPMPGATSTDVTFSADHTLTGLYAGTWSISGDTVSVKVTSMGGMKMDQLKSMMASQPNGGAAAKLIDNLTLKVDSSGKTMSIADAKGNASGIAMFARE